MKIKNNSGGIMKKILTLIVFLFVCANMFALGNAVSEYTTETSDSVYTNVYTAYSWKYQDAGVYVVNTGSDSNDLSFRIRGYMHADASYYKTLATSTALGDGETAILEEAQAPYYKITIEVKETLTDSTTTYEVGYILKH